MTLAHRCRRAQSRHGGDCEERRGEAASLPRSPEGGRIGRVAAEGLVRSGGRLGGAAAAGGQLANVVEEDRALQGVELRGVRGDLGEERIGHEDRGLVRVAGGGVAQEGGDVDLEGARRGGRARTAWAWPCRSRSWRCRCGARSCVRRAAAARGCGRGGDRGRRWRPGGLPSAAAGVGTRASGAGAGSGSSTSRHFLQRRQMALACAELHRACSGRSAGPHAASDGRRHHGCHKLCVAGGPRARTAAHVR